MSRFYTFSQNNSGGHFDTDRDDGIAVYTIFEANSAVEANARAQAAGIYFNGCDDERDCPCCGDRWYETDEFEACEHPSVFGQPVEDYWTSQVWTKDEVCVHYLDGRVEWFTPKQAYYDPKTNRMCRTDNGRPVYEEED